MGGECTLEPMGRTQLTVDNRPMTKLAIRCHPSVPVDSEDLEEWLVPSRATPFTTPITAPPSHACSHRRRTRLIARTVAGPLLTQTSQRYPRSSAGASA
jgi:hypothetical protein